MKKSKKAVNGFLGGIVMVYIVIMIFPQFLFANSVHYKHFSVYYDSSELDVEALKSVLDQSESLLAQTKLFQENDHQKIFICNGFTDFAFFAPISRNAFAVNYPLTQHIFLSESSVSENLIRRNAVQHNSRTLSSVIAHETVHSLLENHLGLLAYKTMPAWKNEGYCDYVAKESSYSETKAWDVICNDKDMPDSPSFDYFKYRMFVDYLLVDKAIPLEKFLSTDFDLKLLDKSLQEFSCATK